MLRSKAVTKRVADRVLAALRRHPTILEGGPLVLGVSGGADSLALLRALTALPASVRPALVVAHFSHGMRPSAEGREAALVRRVASELGVPFEHGVGGVDGGHRSNEAEARRARYRFLSTTARKHRASCVAVAHTMDDQAETVLLRLARGAGLRGLASMRELAIIEVDGEALRVFRPLLEVTRGETEAVCAEAGWTPVRDGSNRLLRFARNRVRHRVMPELRSVNPGTTEALAGFAGRAAVDEAFLAEAARAAVEGVERREPALAAWPKEHLRVLPDALFARVLLDAWQHLCGEASAPSHRDVGAARHLVQAPSGGMLELGDGVRFVVEQDECRLTREVGQASALGAGPLLETPLAVPGVTPVGPWLVETRLGRPDAARAQDAWCAVLDADRLGRDLSVRGRRRGDRFEPLGMDRPVRLQDLLVTARVPRSERDTLPLLVGERGIAWVPGVRPAAWAVATEHTRRPLTVSVRRKG